MSLVRPALAYAAAVFAAGFGIGAVRVILLAPRVGETAAVAMEAPVMIAVSWLVWRAVARRLAPPATLPGRLATGAAALALLLAAEVALGVFAFGRSLAEVTAAFARPPGALGLAAQCVFACVPTLELAWRRRRGGSAPHAGCG